MTNSFLVSPSVFIFSAVLLVGMVILLVTRTNNLNKTLIVISIAFLTSIIPLGLRSLNRETQVTSQAASVNTPHSLIIDQVTQDGFNLSWQTDTPSVGTIRLKARDEPPALKRILTEDSNIEIKTHFIGILGLMPGTVYEFEILSGDTWYGKGASSYTVTTLK